MKITVTNITNANISTDVGLISPGQSKSLSMGPEAAYATADGLKTLIDAGRVRVTVVEDSAKLDVVENSAEATSAAMNIYVATTGLNTNPGTLAQPFRTVQAAIDSVPRTVRHLVTINIAAGNYAGFVADGFDFKTGSAGTLVGMILRGTYTNATLAAGTASGTVTAAASGNSATPSFGTLSDSTQTWTVNALKGYHLRISAGPGVGLVWPIASNTATEITVPITTWSTLPTTASTYQIIEM